MSEKKTTTHALIPRQLVVFLRPRSAVWQCRFQIDGKWQRNSTNERNLADASKRAHELLIEANVRKRMNIAPITRYFRDMANLAVRKMDEDTAIGKGKVSFKEYKVTIEKYLIPFFGSYRVDSIDYAVLEEFDKWRTNKMGAAPKHSTLLNHNAALNRVLEVAEENGYIVKGNRPTLDAKAKDSVRRPDFTLRETRALLAHLDEWTAEARADSLPIRQLMKDYVITLLDTGARPGKELLSLKWIHITLEMYPEAIKTGEFSDDGEGNVEEIVQINANRTVFLEIPQSKTKRRIAAGRQPTYEALKAIALRNYNKSLEEMLELGSEENIFMFREVLSEEDVKANKKAKLKPPTSLPKLFDNYLLRHNLQTDPRDNQKRVLYSLRHTYATLALEHDKVEIHTLATQMGTSVAMIEQHYSHLDVIKAIHQLRGSESRKLLEAPGKVDTKYLYTPDIEEAKE